MSIPVSIYRKRDIFVAAGYQCDICGRQIQTKVLNKDDSACCVRIVPPCQGGKDDYDNLVAMCNVCIVLHRQLIRSGVNMEQFKLKGALKRKLNEMSNTRFRLADNTVSQDVRDAYDDVVVVIKPPIALSMSDEEKMLMRLNAERKQGKDDVDTQ